MFVIPRNPHEAVAAKKSPFGIEGAGMIPMGIGVVQRRLNDQLRCGATAGAGRGAAGVVAGAGAGEAAGMGRAGAARGGRPAGGAPGAGRGGRFKPLPAGPGAPTTGRGPAGPGAGRAPPKLLCDRDGPAVMLAGILVAGS